MPPTQSSAAHRSVKASLWIALAEGLAIPTGLVTAGLLTRTLGPSGYGLFTLAASVTATLQWSVATMFSRATVKLVAGAREPEEVAGSLLGVQLTAGMVTALAVFALAAPVADALHSPQLAEYLRLFCLEIFIFSCAFGYRSALIGMGRFERRAWAGGGRWIARLVFIYIFLALGYGVRGAIWGSICASAVELLLSALGTGIWPRLGYLHIIPKLWTLAAPLTLTSICLRFFERADLFLLKRLGGTIEETGIYGAAQNLTVVANIAMMSISPVMLSTLTKQLKGGDTKDTKEAQETANSYCRFAVLLLPLTAIATGASAEILRAIFGPVFAAAAPILAFLLLGSTALIWFSLMNVILIAFHHERWTYKIAAPMLVGTVLISLALVPVYGGTGAALATMITSISGALAATLLARKAAGVRFPLLPFTRSAALGAAMYLASAAWPAEGVWLWVKLTALSAATPCLLALSKEFRQTDWPALRSIVRSGS